MAAFLGMGGTSAYSASKHALLGLTEALRKELEPLGVRVIASLPGGFRTDFWSERSNTIREGLSEVYGDHPAGQVRERSQAHVGREVGDPAKLARLLIQLVEHDDPPVYLVPGADALDYIGAKLEQMTSDLNAQRAVGMATDF
jgi:NAD(P)-dependent dehydrogenase (short-subunit alcohol dehydrogenase family)